MQNPVRNRFLNRLHVESLPGGRARLTAPLHYVTPAGELIVVPRGFETDYASVPSLARLGVMFAFTCWLISIWHPAALVGMFAAYAVIFIAEWLENRDSDEAAVVHDWLYKQQKHWRWQADWILFSALAARGGPENALWKRWLFYVNVRLFGWKPWHDDRPAVRKPQS